MSFTRRKQARFYIDRPLAYRPDRLVVPFRADFHSNGVVYATVNDSVPGGYISLVTPDCNVAGANMAYTGGPGADGIESFMSHYLQYTVLSSKMEFTINRHISPDESEETDSWLIPLMVGITQGQTDEITEVAVGTTGTPTQESLWSIQDRRDTAWEIMQPRQQTLKVSRTWNLKEDEGVDDPWDTSEVSNVWVQDVGANPVTGRIFRGFIGRYCPFPAGAWTGPGNALWWRVQIYYVCEFRGINDAVEGY